MDVEYPGFASLLTAIRQHLDGAVPRWVLEVYAHKLSQLIQAFRQNLALVQIPVGVKTPGGQALDGMGGQIEEFQFVVDHVNMYLTSGDERALECARETLEELIQNWPSFIRGVQKDIERKPGSAGVPPSKDPLSGN